MTDDTFSKERTRRGEPSIRQRAEALADEGELRALIRTLGRPFPHSMHQADEKIRLIERTIDRHANAGPLDLVDVVFQTMISHDLALLTRAQLIVHTKLEEADRRSGAKVGAPSKSVINRELDTIQAQEDHLLDVMQRYVRIRRALALSQQALGERSHSRPRQVRDQQAGRVISFQAAVAEMRKEPGHA